MPVDIENQQNVSSVATNNAVIKKHKSCHWEGPFLCIAILLILGYGGIGIYSFIRSRQGYCEELKDKPFYYIHLFGLTILLNVISLLTIFESGLGIMISIVEFYILCVFKIWSQEVISCVSSGGFFRVLFLMSVVPVVTIIATVVVLAIIAVGYKLLCGARNE